jgi:hypothetical protein
MATRILRTNRDDAALDHLWVSRFLQRDPRVYSTVGRLIEATRAEAADPELIRAFLKLFEQTRVRLGIQDEDIWTTIGEERDQSISLGWLT